MLTLDSLVLLGFAAVVQAWQIPVATAYYGCTTAQTIQTVMNISTLDFGIIDQVLYTEVYPTPAGDLSSSINGPIASQLVSAAHSAGSLAGVLIGGTNAFPQFSNLISTDASRNALVGNISSMVNSYSFDTVQLDWKFTDASLSSDIANLKLFLPAIRSALPNLHIGMTLGSSAASADVASLAQYLDWADLQGFGFWKPQIASTSGAPAPFVNCASQTEANETATSVSDLISKWLNAGWPSSQLVLGIEPSVLNYTAVPSASTSTSLFQASPVSLNDSGVYDINCVDFMVHHGILSSDATQAQGSWTRYWSNCTETPYLISEQQQALLAYEDPQSAAIKAGFAASNGLAGVSLYKIADDAPGQLLLKSAKQSFQSQSSDNSDSVGHRLIALWVVLGIVVLCLCGCVCAFVLVRQRRRRLAKAQKEIRPDMASLGRASSFGSDDKDSSTA